MREAADKLAEELDAEKAADAPDAYEAPAIPKRRPGGKQKPAKKPAKPKAEKERSSLAQAVAARRDKYKETGGCGDELQLALKGADIEAVAKENDIDLGRWAGKNPGMVRMNMGNVLRARLRKGEPVTIGGQLVK